jgi:ADP-ribose pyrophosphatase
VTVLEDIYQGRVVNLRRERVTLPSGNTVDLDLMRHPGASAIVALDDEERVVLIHQYRHAAGGMLWEIPAGTLDDGEAPAVCAARELVEEAGVRAGQLEDLGFIFTVPGFCDERIHLFLARDLEEVEAAPEDDEFIGEVRRVPLSDALRMIDDGELQDAKSSVALLRVARRLGIS